MGDIVYFIEHKKRRDELIASLQRLFSDLERIGKTAASLEAMGVTKSEYVEEYHCVRALLKLECSMAISLNVKDPIMDRVRMFYTTQ